MSSYLLALETSGKAGSVALLKREESISSQAVPVEAFLPEELGSAQSLAPAIDSLVRSLDVTMQDIGCIALLRGPGSFTGLRVGAAIAKTLSYGLKIPLVALDTLEVIQAQVTQQSLGNDRCWVHSMLDAYRGQLFVRSVGDSTVPTRVIDIDRFLEESMALGDGATQLFAGPGCSRVRRFLDKEGRDGVWKDWIGGIGWAEDNSMHPQASMLAILGMKAWENEEFVDPFALLPEYFRGSAAEEKRRTP